MYKLLKPLSVSSLIWALLVTAIVLFVAAGANAQAPDEMTASDSEGSANSLPSQMPPIPAVRTQVEARTPATEPLPPRDTVASSTTNNTAPNARGEAGQTGMRTEAINQRLADIETRRAAIEEKRQSLQNASTTRQARLSEATQERALNGMTRVNSVLITAINKTRDFADRLISRAEDLEARGLDTKAAVDFINQADQQLNLAEQALRDIDINAEYALTSDQPRTDWQDVREQFGSVRTALKSAHELLRSATSELKALLTSPSADTL